MWGAVLFAVGSVAHRWGPVLEAGLSIASIAYGGLLGVFLLGLLTRRVGEKAAMAGMVAGFAMMIYIWLATRIAFTWYVVIGAGTTFLVAYVVFLFGRLVFVLRKEAAGA
jgi:Na+/proline symporter